MHRRRFLTGATSVTACLGAFAVSALGLSPLVGEDMPSRVDLTERLVGALPSRQEASQIGRAHLRMQDETIEAADLVDGITSDLALSSQEAACCTRGELRAILKARNAEDFTAGRTVVVNGWVFGRTEARLFDLAALT